MACECQNPELPHSGGQQFTPTPAQELNVHTQMFGSAQYQATVPLVSKASNTGIYVIILSG